VLDRERLAEIAERARTAFAAKNAAREAALSHCRETTRNSANAIRAVHRGDFDLARQLAGRAGELLAEAKQGLREHEDILFAGFVHDAEKEFVEARCTLAIIEGQPLPGPRELGAELAAYLNGIGETVGELRRHLLDRLRLGEIEHCEAVLAAMDEIYGVLVTFDYPDSMTGGLRRTTDSVRGILERSRGDLVVGARQRDLERSLAAFEARLNPGK
jgi:translin